MSNKNIKSSPQAKFGEFLRTLGLSENETAVYLASLQLGNAIVKDIAKRARLNRTTTYNILLQLRKMGIVSSYQKNNIIHFSAAEPHRITDLLNKRIQKQNELKNLLNNLLPEIKVLYRKQASGASIKIFEGIDSMPDIYGSVYRNLRPNTESLEFTNWGGKYDLFPEQFRYDMFEKLQKQGIWSRSMLIEDDMTRSWYEKSKEGNLAEQRKKIKLLSNPGWDFFCNIELYENRFAIVTYKDDIDFQGVLIESNELSSMFRFLFDAVWSVE
ncbi:MAG: hypothetical protein HYV32_02425 [Candidatus Kerfeldbacteria bacterium]|nr:hypothetical protein [Candidatus Kerfeldbacteria bacterium]